MEVLKGTGKKAYFKEITILKLFPKHMQIFSVDITGKTRPDMDSEVDRRHKKIFNGVRVHFIQCACAEEKTRDSPEVSYGVRYIVIEFVNEKLDPAPPVHSLRRIRQKNVRELEDVI